MSSEQLFQIFPLVPGESVAASLTCESVGEEHEPRVPVELVVTDRRILAWHPRSLFALPLSEIYSVGLIGQQIGITFDGDILLVHEAASAEIATAFARSLWTARSRKVFSPARGDWTAGVRAVLAGLYDEALTLLSSAATLEQCNSGVHILRSVAQRAKRPEEAAASLICAAAMGGALTDLVLPRLAAETRISFVEWYLLMETLEPHSQAVGSSTGTALLLLLDGMRRGDSLTVSSVVADLSSGGSSDAASRTVLHFLGYLGRYGELSRTVAQGLSLCDPFREIATLSAKAARDFSPVTLYRIADLTGNAEARIVANRIGCAWEAQLRAFSNAGPLTESVIDASVDDESAMLAILSNPDFCSLGQAAELVWALLRSERCADALAEVSNDPKRWCERQLATVPSDSPASWIATLAATELLLLNSERSAVETCLNLGFRDLFVTIPQSYDPYRRHAAALFEFYSAAARSDWRRAHMFADQLADSDECFSWTSAALTTFNGSTVVPRRADVRCLLDWLKPQGSVIRTDEALKGLHEALTKATTTDRLRVVVGGETSSGKSSFINALVGEDLLYVTQEEATATPTVVRYSPTYAIRVLGQQGVIDELRFGRSLTQDERDECRAFVRDYTFQMSAKSRGVVQLEIGAPLAQFSENIEFVDTPGINGRDALTRVAEETIDSAHACLFVLDARNALKRTELQAIQYATQAVPKTLFVVNKMDLVLGDEELDCDTSAPDDVIARVQQELAVALNEESVNVSAVCSTAPERLRRSGASPEAVAYAEAIIQLRQSVLRLLEGSRERLIADLAARISTALTKRFIGVALDRAAAVQLEVAKLYQQLPPDPTECRSEIERRVSETWPAIRDEYLRTLDQRLQADSQHVFDSLDRAAQACSDMSDVQRYVQNDVVNAAPELLRIAESVRTSEWQKLTSKVQQVVNGFFAALYRNVSFGKQRSELTIRLATPLPLANRVNELVTHAVDLNSTAKAKEYGPAAVGAAIGTVLLPGIGSAAGFFLGKLLGDGWNAESARELHDSIAAYFHELTGNTWECLVADVSGKGEEFPPLLGGIFDAVEQERSRLETMVRGQIVELEGKLERERAEVESSISVACEAWEWNQAFQHRDLCNTILVS